MEELLTPEVVAERLHVQRSTIMKYLRAGVIKGRKIGRLWRIMEEDLQAYLEHAAQQGERHQAGDGGEGDKP
jgi:excisionase family DNA binding protein